MSVLALCLCGLSSTSHAHELAYYDFSGGLGPTAVHSNMIASDCIVQQTAISWNAGGWAEGSWWTFNDPGNFFHIALTAQAGWAADIDDVSFDFLLSTNTGPYQYAVELKWDTSFAIMTTGWQGMAFSGQWRTNIVTSHGGVPLKDLEGTVHLLLIAKGGSTVGTKWSIDNIRVNGSVHAATPMKLGGVDATGVLQIQNAATSNYQHVQAADALGGAWSNVEGLVNMRFATAQSSVTASPPFGAGGYYRVLSSGKPLTDPDFSGMWEVSSTGPQLKEGVIIMDQMGTNLLYEGRLTGSVRNASFEFKQAGLTVLSGTLTGIVVTGSYMIPNGVGFDTGTYSAVRYTGPHYEVWAGNSALVGINAYADPGSHGYALLGNGTGSAFFAGNYPIYVVEAIAPVWIDAVKKPDGQFIQPGFNITTENTTNSDFVYGIPDTCAALVGYGYRGLRFRGAYVFKHNSWTNFSLVIEPSRAPKPLP